MIRWQRSGETFLTPVDDGSVEVAEDFDAREAARMLVDAMAQHPSAEGLSVHVGDRTVHLWPELRFEGNLTFDTERVMSEVSIALGEKLRAAVA